MKLGKGSSIAGYNLISDFESSANCRWAFAERDGKQFFVKEFFKPKYPPDTMKGTIRSDKLRRCEIFEKRHKRLIAAMGRVCVPGGNIVMPANFFRLGLAYYHIAPRINTASLAPSQIAAFSKDRVLMLTRLLTRSIMTLHSQRIVHGDLKTANVLIQLSDAGVAVPKIIDFDGSYFEHEPPNYDDMAFDQNYVAPEVNDYIKAAAAGGRTAPEKLGSAADVFSIAILLHEYFTGRLPHFDGPEMYASEAVSAGRVPKLDLPGFDLHLISILSCAFALEPRSRPSISDIDTAIATSQSSLRAKKTPSSDAAAPPPSPGSSKSSARPAMSSKEATTPPVTVRVGKWGYSTTLPPPPTYLSKEPPHSKTEDAAAVVIRISKNLEKKTK